MSENGEIYTAGKNFTLPLAVTAVTNSNSEYEVCIKGLDSANEVLDKAATAQHVYTIL